MNSVVSTSASTGEDEGLPLLESGELHSRRPKSSSSLSSSVAPRVKTTETTIHNALIKYGSLLLLVGQMVGLVLVMRYSRTHISNGEMYLASTAVFMMEVMKFILCLGVVFYQLDLSPRALGDEIYNHVWASPNEMLKLCVPSFLYTVQNNLLYLALTNLDAATYQVLYQLKILTTAMFSATMLGRRISSTKWASLVVLTIGVAIVQMSGSSDSHNNDASGKEDRNRLVGLVAVLCAACTSGFSGVYFEKILKGSDVALWIRNIQMGLPSVIIALATVYIEDSREVYQKGFFVGYSPLVFCVVTVQAVGGLIVAVVVKYADNVLKVFATSFSIVFSCIISMFLFDFRPNLLFVGGACLVILSTVMYSKPEYPPLLGAIHHAELHCVYLEQAINITRIPARIRQIVYPQPRENSDAEGIPSSTDKDLQNYLYSGYELWSNIQNYHDNAQYLGIMK
ncbi:hypothetical protein ACHAXA_005625 [Cyclostephanos tholiformis]|uniref:UDP-N-acetylglucosamine transporter n=1 Tax=Cyclostephanos tholiformis TaxID=382380 RepID=A0ABD3RBM4_9STRA